jgi:hypothetical protein
MLYFGIQGLFIVANALLFIGIPNSGCQGILVAIDSINASNGFCTLANMLGAVFAGISTAFQCMVSGKVMILFKATGAYSPGAGSGQTI